MGLVSLLFIPYYSPEPGSPCVTVITDFKEIHRISYV